MNMRLCGVVFNRLAVLSLAAALSGCETPSEPSTSEQSPADPSVSEPPPSTAPVDLITNAADKASHPTHWHVDLGSTYATGDWAFFADGTGAFRLVSPATYCANGGIGSFTWTRLGSDALLVNLALDQFCGPTFTNFANIVGSISSGQFTTALDGNPYPRPFVLQSGALP